MAVRELDALFYDPGSPERTVILCGSGISVPPPTAAFTVNHFIEELSTRVALKTGAPQALVDGVLWGAGKFPRLRFELVCFCLKEIDRGYSFLNPLRTRAVPDGFAPLPNFYHLTIARLIIHGATAVTTNFDCFIEHALLLFGEINRAELQLQKPHGTAQRWDGDTFVNEPPEGIATTIFDVARGSQIGSFPDHLVPMMEAIEDRHLIVAGYSASDSFDIQLALLESRPSSCDWFVHAAAPLERVDLDSPDIPVTVHALLASWRDKGVSVRCVRGDLGYRGGATASLQPNLHKLFQRYRADQCWYFMGRLALNQGNYAVARQCFAKAHESSFKSIKEWSLRYLARSQDTWPAMLNHAVAARSVLRAPDTRIANEYMILDALCVLERKADFLKQFQYFRSLLQHRTLRGPYPASLHRARALHCAGLYFRYSRRPKLALLAFKASLVGRLSAGEPIDIFKANNGIFSATLELGGPAAVATLFSLLTTYAHDINDDNIWLEYWQSAAEFRLAEARPDEAIRNLNRAKRRLPAMGDVDTVLSACTLTQALLLMGRLRWAATAKAYFLERCAALGMTDTASRLREIPG